MRDFTKSYFQIAWIVCLIFAILYSITIVGLILGIPLFIAMGKLKAAAEYSDEELIQKRSSLFGWGIFLAIVLAPSIIGMIAILICVVMVNNYIKNLEAGDIEKANKGFGETIKQGTSNAWQDLKETFGVKSSLDKEKEQLKKLQEMRNDGILTEEEYEAKRKQILKID